MKVAPIVSPLPGEHLATTSPKMAPETPIDWRQRLNFWAGRALTAEALELEQENRAAELARQGRLVTAGVVRGLEVALEAPATPPDPLAMAGHFIHLLPGHGFTISGEDVTIPRPLRIALDQIPVHYVRYQEADEPAPIDASESTPLEFGGLKLVRDDFESGFVPWAAVLVARPAELRIFGDVDPSDPCELDPSRDAFADERRLDAALLRLFQIPLQWQDDPLLADDNDARWRNRLAQVIFREESKGAARQYLRFLASHPEGEQWDTVLAPDDIFPWEFFGLPLALLSSEVVPDAARSFYLDRASVTRPGGRMRARSRPTLHLATEETNETLHPPATGTPALWRARVDQFAEQLSRYSDLAPDEMATRFQFLPPAGLLPRNALDFLATDNARMLPPSAPGLPPDRAAVSHFFPESMEVEAVPMPVEDLDAALAASAPLAPFDFAASDSDLVRVLVPVAQEAFDPRLLVVELEDPFFALEVARLVAVRQDWRQRRDFHRTWFDTLKAFISGPGTPPPQPALEAGQFEPEPVETAAELPPAAWLSPNDTPGPWEISAPFGNATPLVPSTILYIGLRHDFDHPPTRVEVRWQRRNEEFSHVWTEPSQTFAERFDETGNPLPIPLTRFYTVTASVLGVTDGILTDFTLHLEDGRAGVTEAGSLTSEGRTQWWSANDAGEVTFLGGAWTLITDAHLSAPFEELAEPDFGESDGDLDSRTSEVESALQPAGITPRADAITVAHDGLEKALATLEAEANEADDFVDANFLRAQTNLYRIRKLILGETAAQKLLINPAISVIADQTTAAASADQLNTYLAAARSRSVSKEAVGTALGAAGATAPAAPVMSGSPLTRTSAIALTTKVNPLVTGAALRSTGVFASTTAAATAGTSPTFVPRAADVRITPQIAILETTPPKISAVENLKAISLKNVFGQLPESGPILPPRGLSIGERFTEPPATSNLAFARSALVTLLGRLPKLRLPLIDETVRSLKGTDISLLELQGRALPPSETEKKRTDAVAALLATDATTDTDEAEVTLAALDLIEVKSAILRTIEAVIQKRRALLTRGQETLAAIETSAASTQSRLGVLASSLAEARHDVNVARALRQEEQERVAAINTRRDDILRDEVKFLAYVRPRAVDIVRRGVPGWKLENGDAPATIPACLRLHDQPPDALRAYVQLFQQAPARWFPDVGPRLKLLDNRDKLVELLAATQQSALIFSAQQRVAFAQQVTQVATQNTLLAAFSRVEPFRAKAATLQIAASNTISWTKLQEQAQDHSSLGDIIGGRHGNPALAQSAATTLGQIESVATCLHAEFAAVSAATRLLWVERYSQFDRPAPLRDLTLLPGYGKLDRATRRRFQAFVDWLFQRVDNGVPDAVNLINDLVRICLLLASHAPVKSLIAGHLPRPVPVRPGVLIPVRPFDPNQVKVGMEVHVWKASTLVAQGRVEDLGDGEVSARVEKIHAAATTLDQTMQVQFVPAALGITKSFALR